MLRIHRGDAGVAVDDAFVGRHLCTLVVGAIAVAEPTRRATAIVAMRREPFAQLLRILRDPRDPRRGLGRDIGLELQRIALSVPLQHRPGGSLQLLGPLRELDARAAPMFRRIAR